MKATKRNSGVYQYLNERGLLASGDIEAIRAAKKEYRKKYLIDYKKEHKRMVKEFSITCNPKEAKVILAGAQQHAIPPATFIKRAVFAYLEKAYVTPHVHILYELQQILLRSESLIRRIAEKNKNTSWFRSNNSYTDLEQVIREVRNQVTQTLTNPPKK